MREPYNMGSKFEGTKATLRTFLILSRSLSGLGMIFDFLEILKRRWWYTILLTCRLMIRKLG
jgi:hypothetical protein